MAPSPLNSSANARRRRAGFTLLEVMIATTILAMATGMTIVVYVAAMKRAQHTENMLKGTSELRYTADMISQAIRSAPSLPTVSSDGLTLYVTPKDEGVYFVVQNGTWIDSGHTTQGWKSNQKTVQVDAVLSSVADNVFSGTNRPTGALSSGQVGTYFVTSSTGSTPKVSDLIQANDTLSIPETAFGSAVSSITINSVSNNAGTATVTFTTNLGVDVPDGTELSIASGRQYMFKVLKTAGTNTKVGDLLYYPDSRNTAQYTILAHDIDWQPLSDPSNSTSARSTPFSIASTATDYVTLNLQKVPQGTAAGRTLQGVITAAYTRTSPTLP
ncbi:MAG TPA: prepilin-type N-terminal cleavage/methylation domain-containing protein [Opitutaceae bacterium]|nr:prepilin-type N-terminal cleavage/methylation domain-containing protein [Opitutaceae bacterium]